MLITGCEGCCFLKQDDKGRGCAILQMCALKDGKVFAPGYCRLCRSKKWANEQVTTDVILLHQKVIQECCLKFDMLVFFDEAVHTIKDLETTLNLDWYSSYTRKIIIMDVTGFGDRQNLALQYIKSHRHHIPIMVDSSTEHESISQREKTLRRVSRQVTAKFFMAVPAGSILNNFNSFAEMIQTIPSRVIHWSFPFSMGQTAMIPTQLCHGLFITKPYKVLTSNSKVESFTERLRKEENETETGLTWLSTNCWMTR